MILCPIAAAVGCRRCPAYALCPLKAVIGDQKRDVAPAEDAVSTPASPPAKARRKAATNRKRARARRARR